jgi:hypothetical protein
MSRSLCLGTLCAACLSLACSSEHLDPASQATAPTDPTSWLTELAAKLAPGAAPAPAASSGGFTLSDAEGALELRIEPQSRELRLKRGDSRLGIRRIGARAARLAAREATLFEADGAPDLRAAFFARNGGIEELIHVAHARAVVGYEFDGPPGFSVRVSNNQPPLLQVNDANGKVLARATFPAIFDAAGRTWSAELRSDQNSVVVVLPEAATYPIVIDPLWSDAANLTTGRYLHTATLLLDGTVLLVGGSDQPSGPGREFFGVGGNALAAAEVYDSQTRSFEPVGKLAEARWGHSATLLRDGRVLMLGGFDDQFDALASSEIYDPASRELEPFAALKHPRGAHTATLLADGRVLVVGGLASALTAQVVGTVEVCLPEEQRCEELGATELLTRGHAAVLRTDGHVDFLSPGPSEMSAPSFARFDPSTNLITSGSAFPPQVQGPFGTGVILRLIPKTEQLEVLTPKRHVIVDEAKQLVASIEQELPGSGLMLPTTVTVSQGRGLAVGGDLGALNSPLALLERDPYGSWDTTLFLNKARSWSSATPLADGSVLVAGGGALASAETLTPDWQATERVAGLDELAGSGHAATLLEDGRVLFTGGWARPTNSRAAKFVVPRDPSALLSADSEPVGELRARRALHQALLLPNGKVLIAGGKTEPEGAQEELLDVETGKSAALGLRLHDRGSGLHVSGTTFVFAGLRGVEVLDTSSWKERRLPLPSEPDCDAPGLVRLRNGHALVLGRKSVFELDALSGELVHEAARKQPRCDSGAAVLQDGTVFIAGGNAANDPDLDSLSSHPGKASELYDPADGTLKELPKLLFALARPAAFTEATFHVLVAATGPEFSSTLNCDITSSGTLCPPASESSFAPLASAASYTRLPFGGILSASGRNQDGEHYRQALWLRTQPLRLGLPEHLPAKALQVTQGAEVTLEVELSTTWPEQSGGTSNGSAANAPVPVWIPSAGGPPAIGTFLKWTESFAVWRVPRTPFPGLGSLFYSVGGVLRPLRPVRILEQAAGDFCQEQGECATGYCVDHVCCNGACTGACHACSAEAKGYGEDGKCEVVQEGKPEASCEHQKEATCGTTGLCDAAGQCATYPDGMRCDSDGSTCTAGHCRPAPSAVCEQDGHTSSAGGDCSPYKCSSTSGTCLETCSINSDCIEDYICSSDSRHCVALQVGPRTSAGCAPSCRVAGGREGTSAWLGTLALGFVLLLRRARRRQLPVLLHLDARRRGRDRGHRRGGRGRSVARHGRGSQRGT